MMEDYQGFFISEIAKTSFELYYGWGKKKKKEIPVALYKIILISFYGTAWQSGVPACGWV